MQFACAILSSEACPAVQYFNVLSQNGTSIEKNVTETKMSVSIFSTILSKLFLVLRRTERDRIKNVHWYSCKALYILVRF